MRNYIIIQTADGEHGNIQIKRGFDIGRVEIAGLGRMRIKAHCNVEEPLDVRHRPIYIQQGAIGMSGGYGQAVRFREGDDGLIIFFSRAKTHGKLLRCEEAMVIGTGRVVEFLEQMIEFILVAQGQPQREIQML